MATNSMKSVMATFMIIMFVFSPVLMPCDAARLTYQEFGVKLEKCGPCTCCQPNSPPCCLCACPVPP
ncbi:hypothetical protein Pfo_012178 [Paulownia fortunei]|nr:hypothetical protein Pfo_012178 [Paulownia fortunei]